MPEPSTRPVTVLITAGEASGDRQGAALMAALKRKRTDLRFIGVGGPLMEEQGLQSLFPMSDLAVMGLAEVLPAIPRILYRLSQLNRLAEQELPALAVLIDAQDFSSRLAASLQTLRIPCVHYVAPKVWAWRPERVKKLKALYTELLTNLPFEEPFFTNAGIATSYVGHPAVTTLAPYLKKANGKPDKVPTLALLPGSRRSELHHHWPLMLNTFRRLKAQFSTLQGVLALPDEASLRTCLNIKPWHVSEEIKPVYGEGRFPVLASATAALAKSGTVNLELALLRVPSVVCYRMNPLTYWLAKRMVTVPFISLPNLILNPQAVGVDQHGNRGSLTQVYPEFVQHDAVVENLAHALHPLIAGGGERENQLSLLQKVAEHMATEKPPAELAAERILRHLPRL